MSNSKECLKPGFIEHLNKDQYLYKTEKPKKIQQVFRLPEVANFGKVNIWGKQM